MTLVAASQEAIRRAVYTGVAALCWACGAGAADAGGTLLAPDFTRADLTSHRQRLSDYSGKVVLLSFWATWCEPCIGELATFSRWQSSYAKSGLQVIGIAMDDDAAAVRAAVRRYRVGYPVVLGDPDLGRLYGGVYGLPLNVLVDRAGRIVVRIQGEADAARLEQSIRSLLASDGR